MADPTLPPVCGASPGTDEAAFAQAAKRRWNELGEELKTDVAEYNARNGQASFSQPEKDRYRIESSQSGVALTITADFEGQVVRYEYAPVNRRTAGAPEGGILAMRKCAQDKVEFYSSDERLTPAETRQVLLQPVFQPSQLAA